MEYDSLTRAQRQTYIDACSRTHRREVELQLLDLNGRIIRSIAEDFMGGSVQGDETRTPVEVCEVDVFDPDGQLDWSHGRHRKYQIRVTDSRFIDAFDAWVDAVVFTGPLWDFSREDDTVHLVAHGSELHAMGNLRQVYSVGRKVRATKVIRDLLRLSGAPWSGLSIPEMPYKLPERITIGVERRVNTGPTKVALGTKKKTPNIAASETVQMYRANSEDTYWSAATEVAEAIDRELYSDARGRYVLRAPTTQPAVTVRADQLVSAVTEQRGEAGEVTNTWHIYGAKPKGAKKRVHIKASLPKAHPLSAQGLARGGKPREVIERIENNNIRTAADARKLAARKRDRAARELVTYEVEMMPVVPWLRPSSLASLPAPSGRTRTRIRQWTLPLGPGADPLVLGGNRRRTLALPRQPRKRWQLRSETVGGLRSRVVKPSRVRSAWA